MIRFLVVFLAMLLMLSCTRNSSKNINKILESKVDSSSQLSVQSEKLYSFSPQPFRLTVHQESNWTPQIDSINEVEFAQEKKYKFQEQDIDGDSLVNVLSTKFKNAIALTDSCCTLKGFDKDLKVCRKKAGDSREWSNYEGIGYENGYLIILKSGYEWWDYISFNPITKKYFYTSNLPHFTNDSLIYSAGNYYAEGQFQIIDTKQNKYFGFESFNWELKGFYREKESFFLEFESSSNKRYLKVTFN